MQTINSLPFAQLKNAEHVAFFNNVVIAIDTLGAEDLGLATAQFTAFKTAVTNEQDIVLKAQGSMYTADMVAADKERDALYSLIHHKLMAVSLYPDKSVMASLKAPLEKYILCKYNTDIVALPYQEETAHLTGFIMDMRAQFSEDDLESMGITNDLGQLKAANERFSALYNQRAMERSGSTAELTKQLRAECEELYAMIKLQTEFTANMSGSTDQGVLCGQLLGVINQIVRDARTRLNQRLGKAPEESEEETPEENPSAGDEPGLDENVSPIPFPKG